MALTAFCSFLSGCPALRVPSFMLSWSPSLPISRTNCDLLQRLLHVPVDLPWYRGPLWPYHSLIGHSSGADARRLVGSPTCVPLPFARACRFLVPDIMVAELCVRALTVVLLPASFVCARLPYVVASRNRKLDVMTTAKATS